ncbi:uncharacterized protein LOC114750199 [Neltuma alba]|uniref:uncharacterized protein LOC114750199 n=1 Tax=Neltuma alba TaxID=207710 RepID=UPI0010A31BA0|nr:uncharacterized protein LOC114750199 [Prosopis alba]
MDIDFTSGTEDEKQGLIRNRDGEFLQGFIYRLDEGDALTAELWADGHRQVILESDATNAIELLNLELDESHADFNVLKEVRVLLNRGWSVRIEYVNREANKAADYLAKAGLDALRGFHFISIAPLGLVPILDSDRNITISGHAEC